MVARAFNKQNRWNSDRGRSGTMRRTHNTASIIVPRPHSIIRLQNCYTRTEKQFSNDYKDLHCSLAWGVTNCCIFTLAHSKCFKQWQNYLNVLIHPNVNVASFCFQSLKFAVVQKYMHKAVPCTVHTLFIYT